MDFNALFRIILPALTVVAGAASAIAHTAGGVTHPLWIDTIAGLLASLSGAKALSKSHSDDSGTINP